MLLAGACDALGSASFLGGAPARAAAWVVAMEAIYSDLLSHKVCMGCKFVNICVRRLATAILPAHCHLQVAKFPEVDLSTYTGGLLHLLARHHILSNHMHNWSPSCAQIRGAFQIP